jgi:hypothetical protein
LDFAGGRLDVGDRRVEPREGRAGEDVREAMSGSLPVRPHW